VQKRLPTEALRDEKTILTAPNQPRLDIRNVSKSFGGIRALRDVSFVVKPGEVHALIGENGAGKSTLVKIVTGLEQPDTGEIPLNGAPCHFRSPMEARRSGVVAVYQEPKVFPHRRANYWQTDDRGALDHQPQLDAILYQGSSRLRQRCSG
jgi:ABC-type uncharacterized transport system ATPase subunit